MTKEAKKNLKISTIFLMLLILLLISLILTLFFPKLVLIFFVSYFVTMIWGMVKIGKYLDEPDISFYDLNSNLFAKKVDLDKIFK